MNPESYPGAVSIKFQRKGSIRRAWWLGCRHGIASIAGPASRCVEVSLGLTGVGRVFFEELERMDPAETAVGSVQLVPGIAVSGEVKFAATCGRAGARNGGNEEYHVRCCQRFPEHV